MHRLSYQFTLLFIIIVFFTSAQERVGLVLSGGGASGIAHVGVLKALEERGIPIDFIAGSSSGALVGSLYACGYSPEEIEAFVLSEKFQDMSKGVVDAKHHFFYRQEDANASTFNFSISRDSILRKSIPLSIITPILMDFEMLNSLGIISAAHKNDFNNLFVPFRSVASDVINKKSVVFRSGNLNEAVRASITYPLYINPIKIDGKIYFDGGLYNNFPLDVMYKEFNPDFIIGSNLTNNAPVANENDFIGLIN
ncbi:MAG: patatin, partial [Flavobacteriia bacterium]|nr:patatin [Flavobacteriia bacterium]